MANGVGQTLTAPAAITPQSTATPVPAGMTNPLQKLWWQLGNDPAMRRAAQVASFKLLQGGGQDFAANVGTAGLAGLQTLEGVRQSQAQAAQEAARIQAEKEFRDRQIAVQEEQNQLRKREIAQRGFMEQYRYKKQGEDEASRRKWEEEQARLDRESRERLAASGQRVNETAEERFVDKNADSFGRIYGLTPDEARLAAQDFYSVLKAKREGPAYLSELTRREYDAIMGDITRRVHPDGKTMKSPDEVWSEAQDVARRTYGMIDQANSPREMMDIIGRKWKGASGSQGGVQPPPGTGTAQSGPAPQPGTTEAYTPYAIQPQQMQQYYGQTLTSRNGAKYQIVPNSYNPQSDSFEAYDPITQDKQTVPRVYVEKELGK